MNWGDYNRPIVSCSSLIEFGVNDRGGNGAGCFDIEEWADTTELTNVKVAGLGRRKTDVHQRRSRDCEHSGCS